MLESFFDVILNSSTVIRFEFFNAISYREGENVILRKNAFFQTIYQCTPVLTGKSPSDILNYSNLVEKIYLEYIENTNSFANPALNQNIIIYFNNKINL